MVPPHRMVAAYPFVRSSGSLRWYTQRKESFSSLTTFNERTKLISWTHKFALWPLHLHQTTAYYCHASRSFEVRTACCAAERPVRGLSLDVVVRLILDTRFLDGYCSNVPSQAFFDTATGHNLCCITTLHQLAIIGQGIWSSGMTSS
jgi:hypothetical protein